MPYLGHHPCPSAVLSSKQHNNENLNMSRLIKNTTPSLNGSASPRLSSVTTAMRLLKQFSETQEELGISTLARELGVAKSTVHRVASTLVAEGLLEQDPDTELYRLGLALFSLGALVRRRLSVTVVAKPLLTDLRDEFRENVELAVRKGDQVTYVYDFESPRPVRLRSRLGYSQPLTTSAIGLVIAAHQTPEEQARLWAARPNLELADDQPSFLRKLEQIKQQGHSVDEDDGEMGILCIAVPIFNANGTVTSAIGMSMPKQREKPHTIDLMSRNLRKTADEISRQIGFNSDQVNLYT